MTRLIYYYIIFTIVTSFILYLYGQTRKGFQKNLYQWWCKNVYNFDAVFNPEERAFIDFCIEESPKEWYYRPYMLTYVSSFYGRLAFFSYSIELQNDVTPNGTRIAYGLSLPNDRLDSYLYRIATKRNVRLPMEVISHLQFQGIGWDFHAKTIRFYFLYKNLSDIPYQWRQRHMPFPHRSSIQYQSQGIWAYSWNWEQGQEDDVKLYLYTKHTTWMHSTKRSQWIQQHDFVEPSQLPEWVQRTPIFQTIINHYSIDTVSYVSNNKYKVYFPKL